MEKSLWTGQSGFARVFLLVILGIVLYFVGRILRPFFPALAWAAILATVFYPVYEWVLRFLHRRELASALCCVLLTVATAMAGQNISGLSLTRPNTTGSEPSGSSVAEMKDTTNTVLRPNSGSASALSS